MFIIWNFETDKFRSGHRVFKANWVLESIVGKNFRTVPYFIMHAHLINYAFYPLSLNTIDNSLGNWIYKSLIITYRTNKRGFFSQRFFLRCFFLSLSLSPFSPLSLSHFFGRHPSFKAPLSLFFLFFFTLPARFELSILYRLRQTSSLPSIPLFYICFLPIKGNFQNYISNTLIP